MDNYRPISIVPVCSNYCKPLQIRYNGYERELFTDYLFNRKQQVSYLGELSPLESVTCGVPQGSILGPLIFLISFNDVGDSLQFCDLLMYADDTVIFVAGNLVEEIEKSLSSDFKAIQALP